MNETPGAVYKYLTADRTATVLENLQIRFSQASVLNDATELKPPFKGIATQSDLKRFMTDRLRERYPGIVGQVEKSLPSNLAERLIDEVMSKGAAQAEVALPQNAKKIYDSLDMNFGVLSLSETPTDSLLGATMVTAGTVFLFTSIPVTNGFGLSERPEMISVICDVLYTSRSAR
jgi:hypothetical protein